MMLTPEMKMNTQHPLIKVKRSKGNWEKKQTKEKEKKRERKKEGVLLDEEF